MTTCPCRDENFVPAPEISDEQLAAMCRLVQLPDGYEERDRGADREGWSGTLGGSIFIPSEFNQITISPGSNLEFEAHVHENTCVVRLSSVDYDMDLFSEARPTFEQAVEDLMLMLMGHRRIKTSDEIWRESHPVTP